MSKSEEMLLDSLVRLVVAVCSVRWSLAHWLIKKASGEPTARVFAQLALPRASSLFRKQVWCELKALPEQDLIRLLPVLLPHKRRRRFLREKKKALAARIRGFLPLLQEFKSEFEKGMCQLADQNRGDQEPIDRRLYPELQCDLNTLCAEPWRAEKAFPMGILKSPREQKRLQNELSSEQGSYGEQLIAFIWQLATNPYSLDLPAPRSNDLLYKVAQQQPSDSLTSSQAAKALIKLFQALGEERKTKALCDHLMARVLRHEFGLSKDRNVSVFSQIEERQKVARAQAGTERDDEAWQPEDALSMRGYGEVNYRQEYEALRDRLPPKQKLALEVYLESFDSEEPIEDVCARRKLNSVTVRNNFQAVKRKASMGKL